MKLFKLNETTFENYDITVKNYLTKALGAIGLQYSHSQIFNIIFDGIKSIMQNAMFYIEDALTEQNIETAYRKSSIYSLAKVSGYDAFYGSAATGLVNCLVSINNGLNTKSNKVYIKNYTRIINNETGYQYLIYLPSDYYIIDLSKPLNINQFKIIQGTNKTNNYVSVGVPLESINIETGGLFDIEYVEVTVDGGNIVKIELKDHKETPGIFEGAETGVSNEIIRTQSTDVEVVTGATLTSEAIKTAVAEAIKAAK
jgi:hypothetical protein